MGDQPFLVVDVETEQGKGQVIVEPVGDSFRLDWETMVNYAEKEWRTFMAEKPLGKTVRLRCMIRLSPVPDRIIDNIPFDSAEPLIFFEVFFNADTPGSFYACTPQNSRAAEMLLAQLNASANHRATLDLTLMLDKSGETRVALIKEYVQAGWLSLDR